MAVAREKGTRRERIVVVNIVGEGGMIGSRNLLITALRSLRLESKKSSRFEVHGDRPNERSCSFKALQLNQDNSGHLAPTNLAHRANC